MSSASRGSSPRSACEKKVGVLDPAVLVVGSAEQYGRHERSELPLTEDAEQRPLTVYAATKAAQEVVALEAFRSEGVRVVAVRSFNHSGAGQAPTFLLPSLVARTLALKGSSDRNARLAIGNGASMRDFLHVADVVAAYMALVARGRAGEVYNVSSGVGASVKELAVQVLAATGVKAPLAPDPALVRAVDVPSAGGEQHEAPRRHGLGSRHGLCAISLTIWSRGHSIGGPWIPIPVAACLDALISTASWSSAPAHHHRAGRGIRLLGDASAEGAPGGRVRGHPRQLEPGHDHDRPRVSPIAPTSSGDS